MRLTPEEVAALPQRTAEMDKALGDVLRARRKPVFVIECREGHALIRTYATTVGPVGVYEALGTAADPDTGETKSRSRAGTVRFAWDLQRSGLPAIEAVSPQCRCAIQDLKIADWRSKLDVALAGGPHRVRHLESVSSPYRLT